MNVLYSTITPAELITHMLPCYDTGPVQRLRYYSRGINDTYEVFLADGARCFLRVYRTPWRGRADVAYELDALNYLRERGVPAAYPIADREGGYIQTLPAPEGPRCAVLFTLAPGSVPSYKTDVETRCFAYGQAVAGLHNGLDGFTSPHPRAPLDLDTLVDGPLVSAAPFLAHRPADVEYLHGFAARLRARVEALGKLEWGFCHGDLQGYHHHIAEDGTHTFFDFDCCGWGIRAYDLAVFKWCGHLEEGPDRWGPYITGYQSLRPLKEADLRAIPLLVGARYLWHIGLHTGNAYDWSEGWLDDAYFDKAVSNLRAVERDYFAD